MEGENAEGVKCCGKAIKKGDKCWKSYSNMSPSPFGNDYNKGRTLDIALSDLLCGDF